MSTAKELRESALKYGCEYNPKPEQSKLLNECVITVLWFNSALFCTLGSILIPMQPKINFVFEKSTV